MSPHTPVKDPWSTFHASHERLEKDTFFTRILTLVFFLISGAVIGCLFGAFFYPGLTRSMRYQRMLDDTPSQMKTRVIVGAVIGAVLAVSFVINTWRAAKK